MSKGEMGKNISSEYDRQTQRDEKYTEKNIMLKIVHDLFVLAYIYATRKNV